MRIIDMLKSQRLATGNVAIFKIRGGFKSKKLGIVKNTAFVIVLLAVFFIMKPVFADTVIVSQLTGSTDKNTCQYCQSFILPTGYTSVTGIDTYISYSAGTADVYVDLKSGSCYGTLIERKTISNPSAGTYKTIYTSATGLTAGNTYYISYSATSCNKKFVAYNTTNVYADGI